MNNNTLVKTEFIVEITDPWTIAAITLLSILTIVSFYRVYYIVFKRNKSHTRSNTVDVSRVKIQPKTKTNFKTRTEMRTF